MKQFIGDFKENKFLKLYLILFSLLDLIYLYFVVHKSQYAQKNSLEGTIEIYHYNYLANISKITNFLESLIMLICPFYLTRVIIKKDKIKIRQFLIIHFALLIGFTFISYLVSIVFSAPVGNLTQLLFIPYEITFIVSIYFVVNMFYKKIIKHFKTLKS